MPKWAGTKAVRRCMRLRKLLERARAEMAPNTVLAVAIDIAMNQTFYDEPGSPPPSGWEKET